jgi:hypothetical protein
MYTREAQGGEAEIRDVKEKTDQNTHLHAVSEQLRGVLYTKYMLDGRHGDCRSVLKVVA